MVNTVEDIHSPVVLDNFQTHITALRGAFDHAQRHRAELKRLGVEDECFQSFEGLLNSASHGHNNSLPNDMMHDFIRLTEIFGIHLSGLMVKQLVSNDNLTAKQTFSAVTTFNAERDFLLSQAPTQRKG